MKKTQNKDEKNEEIKETSETETYDEYENEAMENAENGSLFEEISLSKSSLSFGVGQVAGSISSSEKEIQLEGNLKDSYEERRKILLQKWFTVTGKKPRHIPTVKRYFDEEFEKIVYFGDRCPQERERNRTRKILQEYKKIQSLGISYRKIRQEIRMPALSPGLQCIRCAPNREFMAISDRNGLVQLRKFPSGEERITLKTKELSKRSAIRALKFYPGNSEKLYVGGQEGVIQVFNTQTGNLEEISNPMGVINTIDISSDGQFLATGGRNGNVRISDPNTLQETWATAWPNLDETTTATVENEYHRLRVYTVKFHPTETCLFVSGGNDCSVKIWDVRIPKAIRSIRGPFVLGEGIDVVDDKFITASWQVENSLNLWEFPSGRLIKNVALQNKSTKYEGEFLYSTKFFQNDPNFGAINNKMVAVGGSGFLELVVLDTETDKVLEYFPSFKAIVTLDIIGNIIMYGGKESTFRVAELETRRRTRQFPRSTFNF